MSSSSHSRHKILLVADNTVISVINDSITFNKLNDMFDFALLCLDISAQDKINYKIRGS